MPCPWPVPWPCHAHGSNLLSPFNISVISYQIFIKFAHPASLTLPDWVVLLITTSEVQWFGSRTDGVQIYPSVERSAFESACFCFHTCCAISFTPHCLCLSEETLKAIGPFCLVSNVYNCHHCSVTENLSGI